MTRERHWLDLIAVSDIISHDVTPVTLGPRDLAVFDTDEGVTVSLARCTPVSYTHLTLPTILLV